MFMINQVKQVSCFYIMGCFRMHNTPSFYFLLQWISVLVCITKSRICFMRVIRKIITIPITTFTKWLFSNSSSMTCKLSITCMQFKKMYPSYLKENKKERSFIFYKLLTPSPLLLLMIKSCSNKIVPRWKIVASKFNVMVDVSYQIFT